MFNSRWTIKHYAYNAFLEVALCELSQNVVNDFHLIDLKIKQNIDVYSFIIQNITFTSLINTNLNQKDDKNVS